MKYPLSTGQAARAIEAIEPQLNDLVRRGKIDPPPPVIAGRRLWGRDHLIQAAGHLGISRDSLEEHLRDIVADMGEGVTRG